MGYIIPVNPDNFDQELNFILKEIQGSTAWSLDRNRPYDGQPHTCNGIRGKTLVTGLTMRDISDCMVRGFLAASAWQREGQPERTNPIYDDIYDIDLEKIDPGAVIQNSLCEIEKMMGIYPNIPPISPKPYQD